MGSEREDLKCPKCKHPLSRHSGNHGDFNSCDGAERSAKRCRCETDREDILWAEIERLRALSPSRGEEAFRCPECGFILHDGSAPDGDGDFDPTLRCPNVDCIAWGSAPTPSRSAPTPRGATTAVSEEAVRHALMVADIAYTAEDGTFEMYTEHPALLRGDDVVRDIVNTLNGKNGPTPTGRGREGAGNV